MDIREKLEEHVEVLMAKGGIEHLSDKDVIVDRVFRELCKYCELREDCDLCHSARTEIEGDMAQYLGN